MLRLFKQQAGWRGNSKSEVTRLHPPVRFVTTYVYIRLDLRSDCQLRALWWGFTTFTWQSGMRRTACANFWLATFKPPKAHQNKLVCACVCVLSGQRELGCFNVWKGPFQDTFNGFGHLRHSFSMGTSAELTAGLADCPLPLCVFFLPAWRDSDVPLTP